MPTKEEMSRFALEIDSLVSKTGYNYIDAVIQYCNNVGLEVEVAAILINPNLKSKIEYEAYQQNMLKGKGARLPI